MVNSSDAYNHLKHKLRLRLAEELDNGSPEEPHTRLSREAILAQLRQLLHALPKEPRLPALSAKEQDQLIEELTEEVVGMGPLEVLLADPQISEIMVNGPHQIYVERQGRLERTTVSFRDTGHLMSVIERLLDPAGVSVSEAEPCVDASLPDGTRINIIIPPLALNGPTVTLRKRLRQFTMADWVQLGSLSDEAARFLEACVRSRVNMVISGAPPPARRRS